MCRPATCRTCGKTTWAGCGQHVDQVMCGVPARDRLPRPRRRAERRWRLVPAQAPRSWLTGATAGPTTRPT